MKKIQIPLWVIIVSLILVVVVHAGAVYYRSKSNGVQNESKKSFGAQELIIDQNFDNLIDNFDKFTAGNSQNIKKQLLKDMIVNCTNISVYGGQLDNGKHLKEYSDQLTNYFNYIFDTEKFDDNENLNKIKNSLDAIKNARLEENFSYLNRSDAFEVLDIMAKPIETQNQISADKAKETANKYDSSCVLKSEDGYYTFEGENTVISVEKTDGKLAIYRNYANIGEESDLSKDILYSCLDKAKNKLEEMGFKNMVSQNFYSKNGEVLIEYYPVYEDVFLFSQRIVVGVNISTGDISLIDATKYNLNNKERTIKKEDFNVEKLKEQYKNRQLQSVYNCIFNDEYGNEIIGYKIKYSVDNQDYVSYVNAKDNQEIKLCKVYNDKYGMYEL